MPSRLSQGCRAVSTSNAMNVVVLIICKAVYAALQRMQTIAARKADQWSLYAAPNHQDFHQLAHFSFGHQPMPLSSEACAVLATGRARHSSAKMRLRRITEDV